MKFRWNILLIHCEGAGKGQGKGQGNITGKRAGKRAAILVRVYGHVNIYGSNN
jgi:hypothetical protein